MEMRRETQSKDIALNYNDTVEGNSICRRCKSIRDELVSQFNRHENVQEPQSLPYHYRVQVGPYSNYNNAFSLQIQLITQGYPAELFRQGDVFAIHIGDFAELEDAVVLERRLRAVRYNTLLVAV